MASSDLNEINTVKLSAKFPVWLQSYLWFVSVKARLGLIVNEREVVDRIMKSTKIEVR